MEQSVLAKSIHSLTAITASLKELSFSNKLVIPEILVAGNKCAGKSSLIEKLIGFEYLPREYVNHPTYRTLILSVFNFTLSILPILSFLKHK